MLILIRNLSSMLSLALTAIVALSVSVHAASLSLAPSADTTLVDLTPFNNMGAVQSLAVGVTGHPSLARALVQFDVTALPAGASVTGVRLVLPVVRQPSLVEETTFALHRVKVAWGEGNQGAGSLTGLGAAATAGEATWAARQHPLTFWRAGGGAAGDDFQATPSATAGAGSALVFESTTELIADVQFWHDNPSGNFGWLIKDVFESETSQTARRLASKENPSAKPELVITYEEAVSLRLVDLAIDGGQLCFGFPGSAGKTYAVERRGEVDTGDWEVIQTIPTLEANGLIRVCDPLGSGPAFYRVAER